MNMYSTKNINNFVDEVRENGYKKVESFLTIEQCLELEKNTIKAFKKAKEKHYHTKTDFVKVLTVSQDEAENIKYFKFLKDFFNDESLISFVKNYFGTDDVEISKIFLSESSNSGEKVDVLPYKLHFDKTRYLKIMIYLRDVGNGDGGITFAKKEWNTKLQEDLLSKQEIQEENVVEVDDLSKIDEIIGKPGTGVIFDTNITHKAGQVLSDNKRLVLRIDTRPKINS